MNYEKLLLEIAKEGLESLEDYVEEDRNILMEEENADDITCVELYTFDENSCTELIVSFEFDDNGKLINKY